MKIHLSLIAVAAVLAVSSLAFAQGGGGGGGGAGGGAGAGSGAGSAGSSGSQGGVGTSAGSAGSGATTSGGVRTNNPIAGGDNSAGVRTNNPVAAPGPSVSDSPPANAPTTGGVIGGYTGTGNVGSGTVPSSPPITGQGEAPVVPPGARGVAEQAPGSNTGRTETAADGVSTRVVPAKPCGVAAQETDGTTTCIGLPSSNRGR
jgi:hypothetical protein